MSNIAIKAEHLSKYYRLGVINNGALFRDLQTWIALKRGKQDPHSRIGENKYDPTKEGFWALSDLNFDIQQGDRVGIIGKNGAGKSTLLKILSRITAPTEGQVKVKGRVASLLEVGTGFHGELTGRENIYLNGAILGMKRREVSRKLDEIIAFSEIEQHIDTPVKRYSSGMYVRLAFAVAAHLDSEILIADEVLAVGDASFQKKALGKMNELSTGQGRTVLFVSHNMGAVKNLCNKGIVLERGKVVCDEKVNIAINCYYNIIDTILKKKSLQNIHDQTLKRSAGSLHFSDIKFNKTEYSVDEKIQIKFTVVSNKPSEGIYFALIIRTEFKETITAIYHELEDHTTAPMYKKNFILDVQNVLKPGKFPLCFWIGDRAALNQLEGVPSNYEVLDELISPITVVPNEMQLHSVYGCNREFDGLVYFKTELIKMEE